MIRLLILFSSLFLIECASHNNKTHKADLLEKANKFYNENELDSALIYYSNYILEDSTDNEVYNSRAMTNIKLENYQSAISDIKKSISLEPNSSDAFFFLGYSFEKIKDYENALNAFNNTISLDTTSSNSYNHRGLVYEMLGLYTESNKDYLKAISIDSNRHVASYARVGQNFLNLDMYKEAIEYFSLMLAKNPNHIEINSVLHNRALCYIKLAKYSLALDDLNSAIKIDSAVSTSYYYRGIALYQMNEKKSACLDIIKAMQMGEEDSFNFYQKCR